MKKLTIFTGAILGCTMGIATAGEPMILAADQMDQVTAGRGFDSNTNVAKLLNIQELIQEQKLGLFQVVTDVFGFSAVAEAEADSEHPFGADSQTFTFAEVFPTTAADGTFTGLFKTTSLSKSIALGGNVGGPTPPAPTVP